MEYVLVDDSVSGVGGTALTLEGLVEPVRDRITTIATHALSIEQVMGNLDKTWVFGNIHNIDRSSFSNLIQALSMVRFFKIEFDYGYCIYRGRIPHRKLGGTECDCDENKRALHYQEIYNLIKNRSNGNFYMSREQMDFHIEDAGVAPDKCYVLSSCFTSSFYSLIGPLSNAADNGRYAIIDGQGGWHSIAKGVDEAIAFAQEKGIPYDLLKTSSQPELMVLLSKYKGLIFHPLIHDTCPRITIEAKLLNLDVRINGRCQHIEEEWWNVGREEMLNYLKGRPDFLWSTINDAVLV